MPGKSGGRGVVDEGASTVAGDDSQALRLDEDQRRSSAHSQAAKETVLGMGNF